MYRLTIYLPILDRLILHHLLSLAYILLLLCLFILIFVTLLSLFFFFNDPPTTEIYTLSLHDALPISCPGSRRARTASASGPRSRPARSSRDRKSTRLNSSHRCISYAVFCLKKKKIKNIIKHHLT